MKWEYRSIAINAEGWFIGGKVNMQLFTERLNDLGSQGWELVNTFDTNQLHGSTREVIAILKRSISGSGQN